MLQIWTLAEQLGPIEMWEVLRSISDEFEHEIEEFSQQQQDKRRAKIA
jgi:hypothetical protein